MQMQKPSLFIYDLTAVLWTPYELANRALDLTKPVINIPDRSPIKLIESNRLRLLISKYKFFDYI